MSAEECPCCGRAYTFRVPLRLDGEMTLQKHYRCGRHGGYIYVHEIDHGVPGTAGDAETAAE